jgi:3-mercaptopyruvate sulfurtransferase SseA
MQIAEKVVMLNSSASGWGRASVSLNAGSQPHLPFAKPYHFSRATVDTAYTRSVNGAAKIQIMDARTMTVAMLLRTREG